MAKLITYTNMTTTNNTEVYAEIYNNSVELTDTFIQSNKVEFSELEREFLIEKTAYSFLYNLSEIAGIEISTLKEGFNAYRILLKKDFATETIGKAIAA